MSSIEEDTCCPNCGADPCQWEEGCACPCGNKTDWKYPHYSWDEYAIKCGKCGAEYG